MEALARTLSFVPLRRVYKDVFCWLDIITVIPFWIRFFVYPASLTPEFYLDNTTRSMTIRVLESLAMFRLLKLVKYYEGSILIARAVVKSVSQLLVPLFMLFAMVMLFSMIVYDLEHDTQIERCLKLWRAQGITSSFFAANPAGVAWDCETCDLVSTDPEANATLTQRCLTCTGFPANHPECIGVAFEQTFKDLPAAMWYTMVTVTTVGYGDMYPVTGLGQIIAMIAMVSGCAASAVSAWVHAFMGATCRRDIDLDLPLSAER